MAEKIDLEHLRWMAQYAGGDDLADINSWKRVKPDLLALVEAVEAAKGVLRTTGPDEDGKKWLTMTPAGVPALRDALDRFDF